MSKTTKIRVLVIKQDDKFVGQCLDFDICTQGDTLTVLMERLQCLVECESQDDGLENIGPAPSEFHDMWEGARAFEDDGSGYKLALAA